jgi:hypothetical protein
LGENTPILESVQPLNTSGIATSFGVSTGTSSMRETVHETHQVHQPSICLVLQKDLNLSQHILVPETEDSNEEFIPYLTKKQTKELHRVA